LDESGSISSTNFTAEKNFAVQTANGFTFGPSGVAASLITYANSPRVITNFTTSKPTFVNYVNTTSQTGGSDDLTAALTAVQNQFTSFGRTNSYRILALLSDGFPNLNPTGIMPKLDELAAAGVHVFPIVVNGGNATYMASLVRNEGQFFALNSNPFMAFINAVNLIPLPSLLGDYNLDNSVNAADFTSWRKTLTTSVAAYAGADGNGSGIIDAGDYDVWRAHFGQIAGSGSGASTDATVPEPATLVMLMLAAVGACLRRRRSK
jgi:uncharacterized protein YegL